VPRGGIGNKLRAGFLACVVAWVTPAGAETLVDSLKLAYSANPQLEAERARQRATDEQVPQALSGWRPTVTAGADLGHRVRDTTLTSPRTTDPAGVAVLLSQPIFRGYKTISGTRQAEATVEAGRQNLLAVEQQVLLDAVTAYMNVIRDRSIVGFRQKNVSVLGEQYEASNARFKVGEITRTDVSQSEARHALSQANLAQARAQLAASEAFYVRVIGRPPGALQYPGISRRIPHSLEAALAEADRISPSILAAAFNADAARHSIDVARGDLLPTITLEGLVEADRDVIARDVSSYGATVRGTISVPLYEAGLVASQVREAKQVASQRQLQVLDARRQVRESVVSAWNLYIAAGQSIAANQAQVNANKLALDGVRQEALVGSRTTLDVLDAEQEFLDSQVQLTTARRDQIVAAYQLLASIGRMTAASLGLSVAAYDPAEYYLYVRDKWIGTHVPE